MKKIFMMAVMAVAALTANAQQEAGTFSLQPKVGLNVTKITGDGTKTKAGFAAGVEGMYQAAEKFGVSAALMYSLQGTKYEGEDKAYNMHYLNIPILAVKAGIQPGFLVGAKHNGNSFSDGCKKFDFAIPVGLSYEISNIVFDARYNIGLTKTAKGDNVEKTKNSVFQFTVGYKFGL